MTNANSPLLYADNVEAIPADEVDDIQRVIQALELILARSQAKTGKFCADVHVKTHGYPLSCAWRQQAGAKLSEPASLGEVCRQSEIGRAHV
jgi:hypothetical protein